MSNAYELRLQLFQEAREYLAAQYERDVLEWNRLEQEKIDIQTKYDADYYRWDALRDEGKASAVNCPICLLYTSPSPRDGLLSRMPSSA